MSTQNPTPFDNIQDMRIQGKILDLIDMIGKYATLSYAQRAIGQPETGCLTQANVELINASNPDNYLRYLRNLATAHVSQKQGTEAEHVEWIHRIKADNLPPTGEVVVEPIESTVAQDAAQKAQE